MPKAKVKPKARRRRIIHPPAMMAPVDALNSLNLMIGQIGGKLESHINAVTHDRAEREDDRRESALYRKEVRRTLDDLKQGVGKIEGLTTRMLAVEKVTGDYKTFRNRLAGGMAMAGLFWALVAEKIKKVFA